MAQAGNGTGASAKISGKGLTSISPNSWNSLATIYLALSLDQPNFLI